MRARYEMLWAAVEEIPPGRVATYGQVAEAAGLPRRARLAGRALRALPDGSAVPWHRVVAAGGRIALTGEAAALQRRLLEEEGVGFTPSGRVDLARFGLGPA